MEKNDIPGMAVGIIAAGNGWVFNYGMASTETRKPVTGNTLFEFGSVTKTFTATLASWAQVNHRLSLSDEVDRYLPSLRNSEFGSVRLINLGRHTPGGLPLQVPDEINNNGQLVNYLKKWRAICPAGTCRTYSI